MAPRRHTRTPIVVLAAAALALVLTACVPVGTTPSGWSSTLAYAHDFPDPSVVLVGSTYYAFATNADMGAGCGFAQIPVVQSTDLQHWTSDCDALPHVGSWANDTNPAQESTKTTWAPSVVQLGPTSFVMYYTAQHRNTTQQCIGVATSTTPQGPYVDSSSTPLVCNGLMYWSLDPAFFRDANGTPYLLWRQDSAPSPSAPSSTSLMSDMAQSNDTYRAAAASGAVHIAIDVQPLSADGSSFAPGSAPVELLSNDVGGQAWESPVIEGPAMVIDSSGTYLLLYSAGDYTTSGYAVGYATCGTSMPVTRCTRGSTSTNPWLSTASTGGTEAGPGGETVFTDTTGHLLVAYHAWLPGSVDQDPPGRQLHVRALGFTTG